MKPVSGRTPGRYRRAGSRHEPPEPLAQAGLAALNDRVWRAV